MNRYIIDLRTYPIEERERMYKILYGNSFLCNIVAGTPGLFEVFWNNNECIENLLHIPSNLVTRL